MKYQLIGSTTSPFVRRIRLAMEEIPYEFKQINIYEGEGKAEIGALNPAKQIPCLLIEGKPLYDSRIILQYLNQNFIKEAMSLEKENQLSAIERMIDAGIVIFMFRKSNLGLDNFYGERISSRIESVMTWLTPFMQSPQAKEWNSVTQLLYCALDWMAFRDIYPKIITETAKNFMSLHADKTIVKQTDPRN